MLINFPDSEKFNKHTAELHRIQALREQDRRSMQSRYTRSFNPRPCPSMPLSSSSGSRRNSLDTADYVINGISDRRNVTQEFERMRIAAAEDFKMRQDKKLTEMLEKLREGSEEVDMN